MMNMFLKKRLAAKKNKKKGFTLIEVIVVIVIIAILAAIAVPSLTRYIGSAGLRADMATGHNIQVVLQAELSSQFASGNLATVAKAAANGVTSNLLKTGSLTVTDVLVFNGITIPTDSLTWVGFTGATAKLESFAYTTDVSTVAYNGTTLRQFPVGTGTDYYADRAAALAAAATWIQA